MLKDGDIINVMKKILLFITGIFILLTMSMTSGCGSNGSRPDVADSIYSAEYINSITIDNPERALALLDTVEQKDLLSKFDIARFRCLAYHNGLSDYKNALRYGLEAYEMPESRQDAEIFLLLLGVIADDYYQNGNYEESVRMCTEGLKLASDSLLRDQEANFDVSLATNLWELGRKDEAYLRLGEASDILEKEAAKYRSYMTADDYVYSLGVYIQSLCSDHRYREAIAMLPRYEQAMDCLESKDDIPDGLVDMRRASAYGAFAYMMALEGDYRDADELYRKLLETDYAKSPDGRGPLIVPYLLARKRYAEALSYLQDEKEYWQANADTLSYDYIDSHLKRELEAYTGLNKTAEALRVANTIQQMSDTLRERERSAKALELAEIYKTQEQALRLEQQSASILIRNIIIGSALIFIILAVVLIIRILRYNKTISSKNKVMVKTIDELIGYKDELFERQEEVFRLRKELDKTKKKTDIETPLTETVEYYNEESTSSEISEKSESLLTEGDKILYNRMNHEVQARRLYLNPNFSRKDLMAEFKISANKFALLFKEFAGCSFTQYIQNCRLDYAVKVMRENPQWNFHAIAKEAQMSNGAFYSNFKRRFGMSPSDFRIGEASISSQKQSE